MTDFIADPADGGLVRLSGIIVNYTQVRKSASFVFTGADRTRMGVIAIAAAMAGLSGQSTAVASNATALEEEADYVQFELNGKPIKGWLWRSPFKDGDVVDVAAEWHDDHYEAFGIARPADKMIALYPHCSRSKTRHVKNAIKWWLIMSGGLEIFSLLLVWFIDSWDGMIAYWFRFMSKDGIWFMIGFFLVFAIAIGSMARQWMPFVRVAEKVFKTLGLPHPGNIDLVKSSRTQRTEHDKPEFGSMYFRY